MPSFALQFRGALTNVSGLVPAEGVDAALLIPIECTSCHEAVSYTHLTLPTICSV